MDEHQRLHHGFLVITNSSEDQAKRVLSEWIVYLFSADVEEQEKALVKKKLDGNNHPDLLHVGAEADIKIENIRETQRWISVPPLEATRKVVWIHQANRLNQASSNALLKTLEEPPKHGLLILTVPSSSQVLPTIRSRLFCIQFPEQKKEDEIEKKEWEDQLDHMLQKASYSDKEIFAFTEMLHSKREELPIFFDRVYQTLIEQMKHSNTARFTQLEKVFDTTVQLEHQLVRSHGSISLGLDRLFMEWRVR